ncbi:MAG: ankyrin repeat domain-containing protein [Gemmataceae bacterium]
MREPKLLKRLHGLADPKEPMVEYFPAELDTLALGAGYLRCRFDPKKEEASIVTEFDSPRQLSKKELHALAEATQGQWLDGVGESFFDDYCEAFDCSVEISPRIKVSQESGRAWKPAKRAKTEKFPKPKAKPAPAQGNVKALSKRLLGAGTTAQVKTLLQQGADANARDEDGFQPLHLPALLRQPGIVQLLLDHGADVNGKATDGEITPLMMAASYGLLPTVQLLLSAGATIHQEDESGWTALVHAVEGAPGEDIRPKPEVIHALLKSGARITPKAMQEAGNHSNPNIVQLLLAAGSDVNASAGGNWTALSSAVQMGNTKVVKVLLEAGADPNCAVYQQTALAAALQAGNTGIAKLLQAAGAR